MNKRALEFLKAYRNSYNYNIYDCYANPSANKRKAYMESIGGHGYRILSFNCKTFTCGFMKDNYLYVITKDNLYTIKLYD